MEIKDKDEVTAMLNSMAATVADFMKAEGLGKAHEGEATPSEVSPDDSATSAPAPEASGSASAGGPPAAPAMDAGPPMEGSSGSSSSSSSSSSGSSGDPAMDGTSDVEALAREYDKLPLPELQAHYMAARTSLMAQMAAQGGGDQAGGDPSAAAPMDPSAGAGAPAAPPAPPPAAAPAPDMEAMKSEAMSKAEKAFGARLAELQKSLDAANAKIAVQGQLVAATGKVLEKLQNRPVIKGIAEHTPSAMRKNEADVESMTKAEINRRLTAAARSGKLAKSDLNKITSFALGKIDVEGVKHLLVEA